MAFDLPYYQAKLATLQQNRQTTYSAYLQSALTFSQTCKDMDAEQAEIEAIIAEKTKDAVGESNPV